MAFVQFSTSGTVRTSSPETGRHNFPTYMHVINPDTLAHLVGNNFTESGSFALTDVHTTLDSYLIAVSNFGYMGDCAMVSGLSPTIPVEVEEFQSARDLSPGTLVINNRDFEDASPSGFTFTVSGHTPGVSGIIVSTGLEGNQYVALSSSTNATLSMIPTISGASGITCGRAIFAGRAAILNGSTKSAFGFAFMRQGSNPSSNGYKVVLETDSNNDQYIIKVNAGQVMSSTDITGTSIGSTMANITLDFSTNAERNLRRNIWLGIEWEAQTSGTLINIYHMFYEDGQTVSDFRQNAVLDRQLYFTGFSDGSLFYNTTSEPVMFILGSEATGNGLTGLDLITLETLPSLSHKGLNSLELIQNNITTTGTSVRPIATNVIYGGGYPPEGSNGSFSNSVNPLMSIPKSLYGRPGNGYSGIRVRPLGGDATDAYFAIYKFRSVAAAGIKFGVARFILGLGAGDSRCKFGFSFLRQGSQVNDNAYTVEFFRNGTNNYQARIRKGTVYDSTFGDASDFNGTIQATSSNVGMSDGDWFALEVRWRALASSTQIEVLSTVLSGDLITFDTTPGTVDYKLTQRLTFNDSSSPYLTTTEVPLIILRGGNAIDPNMYKYELRKSKVGN